MVLRGCFCNEHWLSEFYESFRSCPGLVILCHSRAGMSVTPVTPGRYPANPCCMLTISSVGSCLRDQGGSLRLSTLKTRLLPAILCCLPSSHFTTGITRTTMTMVTTMSERISTRPWVPRAISRRHAASTRMQQARCTWVQDAVVLRVSRRVGLLAKP